MYAKNENSLELAVKRKSSIRCTQAAQKALFGGHTNEADEKASVVSVIGYTGDSLRKTLLNITSGSPLAATLFNVRGTHFIKSSVLESLAEAG